MWMLQEAQFPFVEDEWFGWTLVPNIRVQRSYRWVILIRGPLVISLDPEIFTRSDQELYQGISALYRLKIRFIMNNIMSTLILLLAYKAAI